MLCPPDDSDVTPNNEEDDDEGEGEAEAEAEDEEDEYMDDGFDEVGDGVDAQPYQDEIHVEGKLVEGDPINDVAVFNKMPSSDLLSGETN